MGCVLPGGLAVFLSCPGGLCSCHVLVGCVLVMSWWVVFLSCLGGLLLLLLFIDHTQKGTQYIIIYNTHRI